MKHSDKSNKEYSFYIVGYYGAGNLGDELILDVIIERLLRITTPDNICVTSYDHEYTKSRHNGIRTVDPADLYQSDEYIKNCSLIIIGGGGLFSDDSEVFGDFSAAALFDDPSGGLGLYYAITRMAYLYSVPYITLSTSISEINFSENNKILKNIFDGSSCVYMRDMSSVELACSLVEDKTKVKLTSDPVFMIDPSLKGTESKDNYVLVSVRDWKEGSEDYIDDLGKVLIEFEKLNCRLVFVPFQSRDGEFEDDTKAIDLVIRKNKLKNYEIKNVDIAIESIQDLYINAKAMVGMRLHSLIFSIIYDVPFIAAPYDKKIVNLLLDAHLYEFAIGQNSPADLVSMVLNNEGGFSPRIDAYRRKASKLARLPFEWIESNLKNLPAGSYDKVEEIQRKTASHTRELFYKEINYYKDRELRCRNELAEYKSLREETGGKMHIVVAKFFMRFLVKLNNVIRAQTKNMYNCIKLSIRWTYSHFVPNKIRGRISLAKERWLSGRLSYVYVSNREWPKSSPLVSIVIPYFNRKETIDDTLISIENQTFIDLEVIVVDDGSSDEESADYFKKLKTKYPAFRYIRQKNAGVSAARNKGILESRGKYIVCLDSDDRIDETYIEKCTLYLESHPGVSFVYTDVATFGLTHEEHIKSDFEALHLIDNNMVTTAAMFSRESWLKSGGYKEDIGYEDWEFWINLSEHGFWGARIPEKLFFYRVAASSRYTEDKQKHIHHIKTISKLHPNYVKNIRKHRKLKKGLIIKNDTDRMNYLNMNRSDQYCLRNNSKKDVLIAMPWMTFGGAETLIFNFCSALEGEYDISFVTGLKSKNEWEYKFKDISKKIYHLANMFKNSDEYLEFVSNYIKTRDIKILHIIHTGFMFSMLRELKTRHPGLKIILTMFNDRVEYFEQSIKYQEYIDIFTSDNNKVESHYKELLAKNSNTITIPNGIDAIKLYDRDLYQRQDLRKELGLVESDIACLFVGRLSEEKNPDVFIKAAKKIINSNKLTLSKLKFFIIGDGPMLSVVLDEVGIGKSNRLVYLGYKSEVAKYLAAADIFILPSSIEGFPLSLLEAMSMSLVPVASDVGAVSQVIDDGINGYVIKPGSEKEIVSALSEMAENANLLKTMGENARNKVVKNYTKEMLGANYKNLYKRALS